MGNYKNEIHEAEEEEESGERWWKGIEGCERDGRSEMIGYGER